MCPLCNNPTEFYLAGENREYRLCENCRLIFVPSRFFIPKEEEIKRYLEHENSLDNEGYVNMFLQKIEIVKNLCPGVRTVLDYGCGYEPVLKTLLQTHGFNTRWYDPNFFPELKPDAAFDLIISTETFEHFKEPGKEMIQLTSRLAPQGTLAVMTRFYPSDNGSPDKENFASWYYKRDPTHIAFYCQETFSWIAKNHGFDIIYGNGRDFVVMKKT